jgi:FkbM family methyltransferase
VFDWLIEACRSISFRGKARLLSPMVPRRGMRCALVHGFRMSLDLSEHIQRMMYLGAYEPWETRVVRRYLAPGMCVVDVGANVGYFSLLASACVGRTGRVIAVEPSSPPADRLAHTLAQNHISNIRLVRCGLGRAAGESLLYDPLPDNHAPTMFGAAGAASCIVPVRTLDQLAESERLDDVDLLKLDVEGYEPEVLAGATGLLSTGRIRAILCEFNEHWLTRGGTSARQLYGHIVDCGFVDRNKGDAPGSKLDTRFFVSRAAVAKPTLEASAAGSK